MRVEAVVDGVVVDGVEEWWDGVEAAAHRSPSQYPLLAAISPYGAWRVPTERLADLAEECTQLADGQASGTQAFLSRIADLTRRTIAGQFTELRFNGD